MKKDYDAYIITSEMPCLINRDDFTALCVWNVLHPVEDGPRVCRIDKIFKEENLGITLTALQMNAFNIAFEVPEFKEILTAIKNVRVFTGGK